MDITCLKAQNKLKAGSLKVMRHSFHNKSSHIAWTEYFYITFLRDLYGGTFWVKDYIFLDRSEMVIAVVSLNMACLYLILA